MWPGGVGVDGVTKCVSVCVGGVRVGVSLIHMPLHAVCNSKRWLGVCLLLLTLPQPWSRGVARLNRASGHPCLRLQQFPIPVLTLEMDRPVPLRQPGLVLSFPSFLRPERGLVPRPVPLPATIRIIPQTK